jgi:hypothetical protein
MAGSGAQVICVGVRDDGPFHRLPWIDVKAARFAV